MITATVAAIFAALLKALGIVFMGFFLSVGFNMGNQFYHGNQMVAV